MDTKDLLNLLNIYNRDKAVNKSLLYVEKRDNVLTYGAEITYFYIGTLTNIYQY